LKVCIFIGVNYIIYYLNFLKDLFPFNLDILFFLKKKINKNKKSSPFEIERINIICSTGYLGHVGASTIKYFPTEQTYMQLNVWSLVLMMIVGWALFFFNEQNLFTLNVPELLEITKISLRN
jgi:hypothetical protein